jgi:hypothetical protein
MILKNIFAEKFLRKNGVFAETTASFVQKVDHIIGF